MDSGRDLISEAIEEAPGAASLKEVFDRVNSKLGIDKTYSAWRGILYRNPERRREVYEAMGKGKRKPHREAGDLLGEFDVERFFELQAEAGREWAKRAAPKVIDATVDLQEPIAVVFTSDWHVGGPGTEHLQIREDNRFVASHPNFYAYVGGDWANNFVVPALIHAGAGDIFSPGDQQYAIVKYLLEILAESIIAVGDGNHTDWTKRMSGLEPSLAVLAETPYLYTRNGSLLRLRVGSQVYRIFRRHRPRFSSYINEGHSVVQEYRTSPWEFDIGVLEHHHTPHYSTFDGKYRDDGSTARIAIRPGTYKTVDDHADKGGFYGASSDLVCVVLHPDRFWMQPVRGLQNAADIIDGLT